MVKSGRLKIQNRAAIGRFLCRLNANLTSNQAAKFTVPLQVELKGNLWPSDLVSATLKVEVKRPSVVVSHCWLCGVVRVCKTKATRLHIPELGPRFQTIVYSPRYKNRV